MSDQTAALRHKSPGWIARTGTSLIARLDDRRFRLRIYAIVAILIYCAALGLMAVKARFSQKENRFDFACSDGKYYYIYIASMVIDRDLDFSNQLYDGWGYEKRADGSVNHDELKYPIGVSVSLLPSFLLAHGATHAVFAITHSLRFAPNGYTPIYQFFNLAWVMTLSWATFAMLDGLLSRHLKLRGAAIAFALLALWVGSQYFYQALRFPGMSHLFGAFWVTACIVIVADAIEAIRLRQQVGWHWPAMVFCFAMAGITRPSNIVIAPIFTYAFYVLIKERLFLRLLSWLPLMILACIPVVLQMLVWKALFGHYLAYSYGSVEPFYWSDPRIWQSLVSLRAGLLVWCPVWTLGLIGAILYWRSATSTRWIIACGFIALAGLLYINSSWWCWPFGNYPGRAYIELMFLPAIGLAVLLDRATQISQRRSAIAMLVLAACVGITLLLSVAYDLGKVSRFGNELAEMSIEEARLAR